MSNRVEITSKASRAKKGKSDPQRRKTGSFQSVRSPVDQILFLQRTVGNQAVQRLIKSGAIQAKLRISQPNDIYEQEADRVAEHIMRMPEPEVSKNKTVPELSNYTSIQRRCPECAVNRLQEEETIQPKQGIGSAPEVALESETGINPIKGGGQPLPGSIRSYFEPRFGYDFSGVKIHTDEHAAESASSLNALAYTAGWDIVFGESQYAPETTSGMRLIAHELSHVIQQSKSSVGLGVFRLSPSMCSKSSKCSDPDIKGTGTATSWKLTLAVDREEEGLGRLASGNVGHTWVKLSDNSGTKYSYGFWPQIGFDSSKPFNSVQGCIHHPDTAHEPPRATQYIDIEYSLAYADFVKALAHAEAVCKAVPDYNLFSYNCTTFAINVAEAAGVSPPSSTTLSVHNPNSLFEGIEEETRKRAASGSGAKAGKKSY